MARLRSTQAGSLEFLCHHQVWNTRDMELILTFPWFPGKPWAPESVSSSIEWEWSLKWVKMCPCPLLILKGQICGMHREELGICVLPRSMVRTLFLQPLGLSQINGSLDGVAGPKRSLGEEMKSLVAHKACTSSRYPLTKPSGS